MFPVAVLHGNDDTIAPLEDLLPTFNALGSSEKYIYQAQSDDYGYPPIVADHIAAVTLFGKADTLDWRYFYAGLDQVMAGDDVGAGPSLVGRRAQSAAQTVVSRIVEREEVPAACEAVSGLSDETRRTGQVLGEAQQLVA